ncbi:YdeI/OmpD-associated family protein [Aquimarina hainanensis]
MVFFLFHLLFLRKRTFIFSVEFQFKTRMNNEIPLVDNTYLLQKFPGKGGWTYAHLPEIKPDKTTPFGWVIVKGTIDDYQLQHHKLMPMGDTTLFLPVKAVIRKKINKSAGDYVRIRLFKDTTTLLIPDEITQCLQNESNDIYQKFLSLKEGTKKSYLDWIYSAKKDETKAARILQMMDELACH